MKKVTLKKLGVENYKKFEAREFDFSERTEVSGRKRLEIIWTRRSF